MANRPVFLPRPNEAKLVEIVNLDFEWHPGFARVQKQKSIQSLHEAAKDKTGAEVLEISGKSSNPLGRNLSAFSLSFQKSTWPKCSVECAYQGSKIFENGGPYTDLYLTSSREAKTDSRVKNSGDIIGFSWLGEDWPILPMTYFYDWLYINALLQNMALTEQLLGYQGFTDIEFNPKKSINCQAHSAALFVALQKSGQLDNVMNSQTVLKNSLEAMYRSPPVQGRLI